MFPHSYVVCVNPFVVRPTLGSAERYTVKTAAHCGDECSVPRAGGIITSHDLRAYTSKWREPAETELVDRSRLFSSPAPSSGPILLYVAAMLSHMELTHTEGLQYHRMIEVFKYAYAKINDLADEDFANVTLVSRRWSRSISVPANGLN